MNISNDNKKLVRRKRFRLQLMGVLLVVAAALIPFVEDTVELNIFLLFVGVVIFFIGFNSSDEFLLLLDEDDDEDAIY